MKALVTGCAGFIGSHLVDRLLKEGYRVIGIDCLTDYYPREIKEQNIKGAIAHENFTFIKQDIVEMKKFPEVDIVFHQAAQAGVRTSWGANFEVYTRNNILATQILLEFYKEEKIEKFVYASSSSVYGDADKLPIQEYSPKRPISPYGVTKLAAENLCYLYYKNYSLPVVSFRYFTVYGPRQRPDMAINKFAHRIIEGKEIEVYGNGNQTRDFTYVSDVIEANILAADKDVCGECFNIGGGARISINELIKKLEAKIGETAKVKYSRSEKGDVQHTFADILKSAKILGYKPKVSIDEGIKKYVEYLIGES